jgi:hypothetical protein
MLLIFILLIVPIIVYVVKAAQEKSEEFTKLARLTRLIFICLTLFFSVLLVLENVNYYLVGYRSTSIVYIVTTIAGIVYVLSEKRAILTSFKRTMLNVIAVILMMGSVFATVVIVDDVNKQLVYSDSRFRIEFPPRAPMSPCGLPALFVKKGLVERKTKLLSNDHCVSEEDILSAAITEMDSTYLIRYLIANATDNSQYLLAIEYSKP